MSRGDTDEICQVLRQFGPAPLAYFAQKSEYRDLFAAVHKRYEAGVADLSDKGLADFYGKLERLISLAHLGRPEVTLGDELSFLKALAPDEFGALVSDLSDDELMALLSFVPADLRSRYLQTRDASFVETYARHLLNQPRIAEAQVRRVADTLRARYNERSLEIRKVGRDQFTQIEELLNRLGGVQRSRVFSSLRKESPVVFERLMSEVPLDGAVKHAPASVLNDLFLTLTPDQAAAYLRDHPDRKAVLAKLKTPLARVIDERMGPVLRRAGPELDFVEAEAPEVTSARARVSEIMKTKSAKGEVDLRSLNESVLSTL